MSGTKRKAVLIFIVIETLALILFLKDRVFMDPAVTEIKRPSPDQMEMYSTLSLQSENGREDISFAVKPKAHTKEEINTLISKAKDEIDESVFGKNKDANNISDDLIIRSSYVDGKVSATWSFDRADALDVTGRINLDFVSEPVLVTACCTLKIEDYEEIYSFPMRLLPADTSSPRGFKYLLDEAISKENEKTKNGTFILPSSVQGMKLSWETPKSDSYVLLFIFGIIAAPLVIFGEKEDEKKREKERQKMLEEDYPDIVSSLSLYIGAGINIKGALQRIGESYRKNLTDEKARRPGYEGLLQLLRQITDGAGELESIQSFGKRIGNKNYRKLALLLAQNLRKGNATLVEGLEKEEQGAFEERKLRAKIAGEEASTKLLLPMMGLLGIVIVVLVFPAFIGMGM